jgi:hypothetical protein
MRLDILVNDQKVSHLEYSYSVSDGSAAVWTAPYGWQRDEIIRFDTSLLKKGENVIILRHTGGKWY